MSTGTPRLTPDLAAKAAATSGSGVWHSTPVPGVLRRLHLADGPHGIRQQHDQGDHLGIGDSALATCFPPAVALGATWNVDLVRRVGAALGTEASAMGVDVVLGPGMNIKRSPLCGRNFEYVSEDPHVTARIAAALVEGIQSEGVGACVKHFAANNQETDRMRSSSEVDERTLREIYLPAFEEVIRTTDPAMVMCSYNRLNGVHTSQDPWLLTTLLRGEWGFDGVVVSDWGAVVDRVEAVRAGLDLEMPPSGTDERIVDAVNRGELDETVLDTVVERLARVQERVATDTSRSPEHRAHQALAREAAAEALVLLKNDGDVLPLAPGGSVAVVGEFARSPRYQGGGSSHVAPTRVSSALESFEALAESGGMFEGGVRFAPGFTLGGVAASESEGEAVALAEEALAEEARAEEALAEEAVALTEEARAEEARAEEAVALAEEAVALAAEADTTVLFLGLPDALESEGFDRTDIDLPADQRALLARVRRVSDRVVVVLSNGGVVSVADWRDDADAVLEGWLLGQEGGAATVDVLTGATPPSGRLTETIPLRLSDHASYLNFPGEHGHVRYGEGVFVGYRHFDTLERPVAYPFGFGLTYTTFGYSDLEISEKVPENGTGKGEGKQGTKWEGDGEEEPGWTVTFTVTNTGTRAGQEVAQLYTGLVQAYPTRPVRELRGFAKVALGPGESARVELTVSGRDLSTWDPVHHRWSLAAGTYTVSVGASSRDIRSSGEIVSAGDRFVPPLSRRSTIEDWRAHAIGGPILAEIRAGMEELDSVPDELLRMADSMPLVMLSTFGLGVTEEMVDLLVADVEARRQRAIEHGEITG